MKPTASQVRWIAGIALAAVLVPLLAPAAEAGKRRRYRDCDTRVVRRVVRVSDCAPRVVVRDHRHGSAVAGFLGGLVLGAAVAHASPAVTTGYWDPYCQRGFASLDLYHDHCRHHRHGRAVHVVEVPSGYGWDDYHWCDDCDDGYWGDEHGCD